MEAANKTLPIVQITDNGGKTNQQAVGGKRLLTPCRVKVSGKESGLALPKAAQQHLTQHWSPSPGTEPAWGLWWPGKDHRGSLALSPSEQSSKAAAD